MYKLNINSIKH